MLRHTLADIKKKNCSLRFRLYKSHGKGFEGGDVVQDLYLDTEGLQKVRGSCTNFNKPIYVHQKEAPTRISVNIHLPPLCLFLLYLLYISNFTNTSAFKTVIWTPGTPQEAQQNIKALPAPTNPSSVKEGHSFLSRAQRVTGATGMDALSITERRPAATIISCTVQRWADLKGHASDYKLLQITSTDTCSHKKKK